MKLQFVSESGAPIDDFEIHDIGIHGLAEITLRVVTRSPISSPRPGCLRQSAGGAGAHAVEPGSILRGDLQPNLPDGVGTLCEPPGGVVQTDYNPLISHDFLSALERSGSARNRTGWQPMTSSRRLATARLWTSSLLRQVHSSGRIRIHHGWAEGPMSGPAAAISEAASVRAVHPGNRTPPARGPGPQTLVVRGALADGFADLPALERLLGACHVSDRAGMEQLGAHGYLLRTHRQFHWGKCRLRVLRRLPGRARFAQAQDHPARTRRSAGVGHQHSLAFRIGPDRKRMGRVLRVLYGNGSRKWGHPYLTRSFYSMVGETMRDRILLVMAKRNGRWIAGAINFIGSSTLFGRHWGAIDSIRACISRSAHIKRSNMRSSTSSPGSRRARRVSTRSPAARSADHRYSRTISVDPALRRAVAADFLKHERAAVAEEIEEFAEAAPFRKD